MPGVPIFPNSSEFLEKQKIKYWFFSPYLILFLIFICLFSLFLGLTIHKNKNIPILHLRQTHPDFVDRPLYSKLISKHLKQKSDKLPVVALFGEGGIGKSELAISYGNKHLKDYSLIHWIDSATQESYRKSYEILAEDLGIGVTKQDQTDIVIQKIHRYLESHPFKKPWLLIYDNADQSIPMPQKGNGAILLTTRNSDSWNQFPCIQILPLTQEEAQTLFTNIIGINSSSERLQVIEKLDYLPLALTLAARYIVETPGMSEAEYLEFLDKNPFFFIENFSEEQRYTKSLISSWKIVLEQLYVKDPDVWSCLHFFGLLSPDAIPQSWIAKWLIQNNPTLTAEEIKAKADHVLHFLVSRGLISQHQKSQSLAIHRLKQQCMQFDSHFHPHFSKDVLAFLVSNYESLKFYDAMERSFEFWDEISHWESSAVCFFQHCKENLKEDDLAKLQTLIGNWKCLKGDYEHALTFHEAALNLRRNLMGETHPEIAVSLNNLAWSHWKSGSYELALSLYEKAISIYTSHFGEQHPDVTFITNNLSLVLIEMGSYENAKKINQANLEIRKKHFGLENVQTANSFLNFAWSSLKLGEVDSAIVHYKQALEIYRKLYGENHPYVAICSHHLARAYSVENHYPEVQMLYESAMKFYATFYGKNHPYVAIAQNGLGEAFEKMDKPLQAFEAYLHAFEISLQALKSNHPSQARYFSSLLKLLEKPELARKRKRLKNKVYAICLQYLEKDHTFITSLD